MKKLFLGYLGWVSSERLIEDHEIIMVVADNLEQAKEKLKHKTQLKNWVHIDFVVEVKNIDGYDIILKKEGKESFKKVKQC